MAQHENLSTNEIVEAVTGTVEDLKNFVNQKSLEVEQIENLERAEKNAKNRKTAVEFLQRRQNSLREEAKIEEAEEDIKEAEQILEEFNQTNGNSRTSHNLEASQIMEILSRQSEGVQKVIKDGDFTVEELREVKESEEMYKNRSSVLNEIEHQIDIINKSESVNQAEGEIRKLEESLLDIKTGSNNTTEKQDYKNQEDGYAHTVVDARHSDHPKKLDELSSKVNDLKEEKEDLLITNIKLASLLAELVDEDTELEREKDETEESKGSRVNSNESTHQDNEEDETPKENQEFNIQNVVSKNPEEALQDLKQSSETKEEFRQINRKVRDYLLSELGTNFEKKKLKQTSTLDLLKLYSTAKEDNSDTSEEEDNIDSDDSKNEEEMEKEAEEDLEMLMGAGISSTEDNEGNDIKAKVTEVESQIKDKLRRHKGDQAEETDSGQIKSEKVLDLLDTYRDLSSHEAVIKSAHVVKAYLEYKKGISRELTYSELSDKLDDSRENEEKLAEYFSRISKSEYTGNVSINSDEFIDTSVKVVKRL